MTHPMTLKLRDSVIPHFVEKLNTERTADRLYTTKLVMEWWTYSRAEQMVIENAVVEIAELLSGNARVDMKTELIDYILEWAQGADDYNSLLDGCVRYCESVHKYQRIN